MFIFYECLYFMIEGYNENFEKKNILNWSCP